MNCLSLSEKVIFCEETEKGMIELFNDQVPTLLALLVQRFKHCRLLKCCLPVYRLHHAVLLQNFKKSAVDLLYLYKSTNTDAKATVRVR
jgi:hypothetical protein